MVKMFRSLIYYVCESRLKHDLEISKLINEIVSSKAENLICLMTYSQEELMTRYQIFISEQNIDPSQNLESLISEGF